MIARILLLISVCFVLHCNAQTDQYFPPTTGNEWETLPIDNLNWCQERVDDMVDFVGENNSKAFIILKDGKIVVEEYFGEFTQDSVWYWASAGKTMASFLIGIADGNGDLDINLPTSEYLGEGWTSCSPEQELNITVKNQLSMNSGLDDSENEDCTDPECLIYLAEPGTRWAYHNGPYTLSQDVLEAAVETNINSYLFSNLTVSTGITGAFVPVDYLSVLFSTPRSFTRFGHLLLNQGSWNGTDILGNPDFFNEMISPSQELNEAYGYLTWLNGQNSFQLPGLQFEFQGSIIPNGPTDMYCALGKNDQMLNIVPSLGLVVMRMGDAVDSNSLVPTDFNNDLWEHINGLECTDSVSESELAEVSIFPNPVSETLNISGINAVKVSLVDFTGKEVLKTENSQTLDVFGLPTGIYTIIIQSETNVVSRLIAVH